MKELFIKIGSWIPVAILIGFVLFGSYQYYFKKPVPIVNNTTVEPGATMNVEQNKTVSNGHLYTGLSGNKDQVMLEVGWIW